METILEGKLVSKLITILILLCNFELQASNEGTLTNHAFFKNLSQHYGVYEVKKGSDDMCSGGDLKAVGGDITQGFRLGQAIFFGPFNDLSVEKLSDGCEIKSEYKFSENSIEEKRVASGCKNMQTSTKLMTLGKKEITFEISESSFKCTFSKQSTKRGSM